MKPPTTPGSQASHHLNPALVQAIANRFPALAQIVLKNKRTNCCALKNQNVAKYSTNFDNIPFAGTNIKH